MLRSGFTAMRDIARVIGIPFDPDPMPDTPIQLSYEEFADAVKHIEESGYRIERSAEEAFPHFRGWRINYEEIAYRMARKFDAVPAPWSGERDWPSVPLNPTRPEDRRPEARAQASTKP
jgi:hypothetical protein